MSVSLHVHEGGPPDGPPLVLLHGVGNSHRTYGFLPAAITDRCRVLAVDLRGHGSSPRTPGAYGLDDYAGDVADLLRTTGPAVVVGHSLGGVITWTLAQRCPDLVAAALVEDPPLYGGEPAEHAVNPAVGLFRVLRERVARWQDLGTDPAEVAAAMGAAPAGRGGLTIADVQAPDTLLGRARSLLEIDLGVLDGVIDGSSLAGVDTASPLAVPVRVLAADEAAGAALHDRHLDRLGAEHPEVSVRRLAGAGHGIHDEVGFRDTYLAELDGVLSGAFAG